PIEYSHFHVPTGSALSSLAPARSPSPSTNAADRIAFMFVSKEVAGGEPSDANCPQPLTAILGMPRLPVRMARPSAFFRAERSASVACEVRPLLGRNRSYPFNRGLNIVQVFQEGLFDHTLE